jgi:hypothetical protein
MLGKAKRGERRSWYQLSGPQRKKLEDLGRNIAVTGDFGRPYRCLLPTLMCALLPSLTLSAPLDMPSCEFHPAIVSTSRSCSRHRRVLHQKRRI